MTILSTLQSSFRFAQAEVQCLGANVCATDLPKVDASSGGVETILRIVFGVIGAAAVIVIIVSAIDLVGSQGDPKALSKQRDTLIYAVVGLALAVSAEVIVTFVLGNV